MTTSGQLLTVPGGWVFDLFFSGGVPDDPLARSEMALRLGIAFWLALLLIVILTLLLLRALRRVRSRLPGRATIRWSRQSLDFRKLRGAIWRLQGVHVVLYLAVPLLWEAGRWLLIVLLLPLMIIGFGDSRISRTDGTLDHLRSPSCWTFIGVCTGPRSDYLHSPVMDFNRCDASGRCPPPSARLHDYGGWGWKTLWLAISLGWILPWWRRAEPRPA